MTAGSVDPATRPELWRGAVTWERVAGGIRPWRLDPEDAPLAYAPELFERARAAAGVRLEMRTDARRLELELDVAGAEPLPFDLVVDGELRARRKVAGPASLDFDLPGSDAAVALWLPQGGEVVVRRAAVRDATSAEPSRSAPRWVAYGSSITQCVASPGPSETWPALVARRLDLDLTCLGFSAECHLDPVVVRQIAALPAELISLCLGINVYGRLSFSARSWRGQVADFIRRVREGHPGTPLLVTSPIGCPARESTPNANGMTLRDLRDGVHEVVRDLAGRGDAAIRLVDGRDLLAESEARHLFDGLHPDQEGNVLIASRVAAALRAAAGDIVPAG